MCVVVLHDDAAGNELDMVHEGCGFHERRARHCIAITRFVPQKQAYRAFFVLADSMLKFEAGIDAKECNVVQSRRIHGHAAARNVMLNECKFIHACDG